VTHLTGNVIINSFFVRHSETVLRGR